MSDCVFRMESTACCRMQAVSAVRHALSAALAAGAKDRSKISRMNNLMGINLVQTATAYKRLFLTYKRRRAYSRRMLDFLFNRSADPGDPPNIMSVRELERMLACTVAQGRTDFGIIGDPGDPDASYVFHNRLDGEAFELGVYSRRPDGNAYGSYVAAQRVGMAAFEIIAIVLDNHPEKLDNEKEIRAALDFIGGQVRAIYRGEMPAIHHPYGTFSSVGRFITRLLPPRGAKGFGLF